MIPILIAFSLGYGLAIVFHNNKFELSFLKKRLYEEMNNNLHLELAIKDITNQYFEEKRRGRYES